MAAVLVQIRGTLYDLTKRTSQQVLLQGEASMLGLGIGGGPIIPPEGGSGGGDGPVHIWGPPDMPPGFWGGGMGPGVKPQPPSDVHPEHPIVLPDPPTEPPPEGTPPDENGFLKPPPAGGGWAYHNVYAWMYDPPPGVATPKA